MRRLFARCHHCKWTFISGPWTSKLNWGETWREIRTHREATGHGITLTMEVKLA